MPEPEKEYRIVATVPDHPFGTGTSGPMNSPREAGDAYRTTREWMRQSGIKGIVEIQSRDVRPWETVKRQRDMRTIQATLFDAPPIVEPEPPHNGTPTSKEAADSMRGHASRLRGVVLDAIRGAGARGMTTDEVEVATGLIHQCASPRVIELFRAGLIREAVDGAGATAKRKTRSKRLAVVYLATENQP